MIDLRDALGASKRALTDDERAELAAYREELEAQWLQASTMAERLPQRWHSVLVNQGAALHGFIAAIDKGLGTEGPASP